MPPLRGFFGDITSAGGLTELRHEKFTPNDSIPIPILV
jgi:hypothetical protein